MVPFLGRALALFCVGVGLCVLWQAGDFQEYAFRVAATSVDDWRRALWNAGRLEATGTMGEEAMLQAIEAALGAISYPHIDRVRAHAGRLARRFEERFDGYKFVRMGAVHWPGARYMTDLDLYFSHSDPGLLSARDLEDLRGAALELFGLERITRVMVTHEEEVRLDGGVEYWSAVGGSVANGADLVLITGQHEMSDGWQVSMDIALQRQKRTSWNSSSAGSAPAARGGAKSANLWRVDNIRRKLAGQNYASAVTRMRGMLPQDRANAWARAWGDSGGRMRFLVKQLKLLRSMPRGDASRYMQEKLRLPAEPAPEAWEAVAESEMQRLALAFLLEQRALYEDLLTESEQDVIPSIERASRARLGALRGSRTGG